jgi:hypothetical protein
MSTHPRPLLLESLVLSALVFYVAMAMVLLISLVNWMLGGQDLVLNASWVRWCAAVAIVPLVLRLTLRPDARIVWRRFKRWCAGFRTYRCVHLSDEEQLTRKEQRHYPRYHVEMPARVSTDKGNSGLAMIADLSAKGCRVKSKTLVSPGDSGKLVIHAPSGITPLTVSLTSVRWVKGYECGLEFIFIDLDELGCFNRCLSRAKNPLEPVPAVVS